MRQQIRKALVGAMVGALVGMAAAVMIARVSDSRASSAGVARSSAAAPVTVQQVAAIAMQMINVVRQIINLA